MKSLIKLKEVNIIPFILLSISGFITSQLSAQQVEVQGELKVTQMTVDDTQENLVIRNADGTLGSRSVASLPPPPPPIDTTRNLASDLELAKHLCDCPNLPPFLIKKLLESGYNEGDLAGSGVPEQDIIDAIRFGSFLDSRDNQFYKTVTIGTQTWMAENLNYGSRIDGSLDQTDNDYMEKYCYNDIDANCTSYGGLYQWDEMMQYETTVGARGVCPTGWHLPSDSEWKTLEMQLGMTQSQADLTGLRGTDQGSQLAGNEPLWIDGILDQNGTFASSGFAGLPAGSRFSDGLFYDQSNYVGFWTSSESEGNAWYRYLQNSNSSVSRYNDSKYYGFSVRCVQN